MPRKRSDSDEAENSGQKFQKDIDDLYGTPEDDKKEDDKEEEKKEK